MSEYSTEVAYFLRMKTEDSNFTKPIPFGTEQRHVKSSLNSGVKNSEEQNIIGINKMEEVKYDSSGNKKITTRFYSDKAPAGYNNTNYYKLESTLYVADVPEVTYSNGTLKYLGAGATYGSGNSNKLREDILYFIPEGKESDSIEMYVKTITKETTSSGNKITTDIVSKYIPALQ